MKQTVTISFKNEQTYQSTVIWLRIKNRQVDNCSHCSGKDVSSQESGTQNGYVTGTKIGQSQIQPPFQDLAPGW